MRPYAYKDVPETCRWCGLKLIMTSRVDVLTSRTEQLHPPKYCQRCVSGPDSKAVEGDWVLVDASRGVYVCQRCKSRRWGIRVKKSNIVPTKIVSKPGFQQNGHFCSPACGMAFGAAAADAGFKIR